MLFLQENRKIIFYFYSLALSHPLNRTTGLLLISDVHVCSLSASSWSEWRRSHSYSLTADLMVMGVAAALFVLLSVNCESSEEQTVNWGWTEWWLTAGLEETSETGEEERRLFLSDIVNSKGADFVLRDDEVREHVREQTSSCLDSPPLMRPNIWTQPAGDGLQIFSWQLCQEPLEH